MLRMMAKESRTSIAFGRISDKVKVKGRGFECLLAA